ncbi:hypothetical protein F962_02484 [Acinetobacter baumannii NIPH 190]|nr:hypothetical protein F962_02484 [Acinetobacter baumannii NIPH 190]
MTKSKNALNLEYLKKISRSNEGVFLCFLFIILSLSIIVTSLIHNDLLDTFLTLLNLFFVIMILFILHRKILKAVFEICNP